MWKLGGIKTVIIGFFVWTNSTFSLLKCCWKTASKQSSNVRLEEWGVFVISLDQSISRKCEKERVESCSTSWTKTFCDGWISGLLRVINGPKNILEFTGQRTSTDTDSFPRLQLIKVNFLLYLLLLGWLLALLWSTWKQSLCQDFSTCRPRDVACDVTDRWCS